MSSQIRDDIDLRISQDCMSTKTHKIVAHQFRHSYGEIIAALVHRFGAHRLQDIEDVVQESLMKAMKIWPFRGIPDKPSAWLIQVAKHALIDKSRSQSRSARVDAKADQASFPSDPVLDTTVEDERLQMIFMCCHPNLSQTDQIILTLKLVAGFGNREVADALLKKEDAVAKAYTRAKKKIQDRAIKFTRPLEIGLTSRLNIVLKIIYLIFTEGYRTQGVKEPIKKDLCYEAIRLALLLVKNKYCDQPNLHALIALMCFHAARFESRVDESGCLVDLAHQDRTLWDRDLIKIGRSYLSRSTQDQQVPAEYLFQAFISYYHCQAPTFEETQWKKILDLYDLELTRFYTPVVALNQIVPYAMLYGPKKGLEKLKVYDNSSSPLINGLYFAIKARLLEEAGHITASREAYKKAISKSKSEAERKYLVRRRNNLVES